MKGANWPGGRETTDTLLIVDKGTGVWGVEQGGRETEKGLTSLKGEDSQGRWRPSQDLSGLFLAVLRAAPSEPMTDDGPDGNAATVLGQSEDQDLSSTTPSSSGSQHHAWHVEQGPRAGMNE